MTHDLNVEQLSKLPPEKILQLSETNVRGLTSPEAARRLKFFGSNEVGKKKRRAALWILASKFTSPLVILLVAAAIISGFLGSKIDSVVIILIIVLSSLIDFFNTYKSEQAAAKLEEGVNITAAIWRNGELAERRMWEVVPGDIVSLSAGDTVPADSVLLEAKDVFASESTLTGESLPVEKESGRESSILWMGTSVVSGKGLAVAVSTGVRTRLGKIASRLGERPVATEFEKNLRTFSMFLFRLIILLILAILLISIIFQRKDPLQIFLFAIAIAVGLTPELLPVIVTANLSKGAIKMSRHGVIVKKLSAIHNFGSMDVLCTDKTGTLTEDKIALVKYVDGEGKIDEKVLFWGYLSSLNVSGIKGSLDQAVDKFKKLDVSGWSKVDELPFDAERRREAIVVRRGAEIKMIAKGAPEEILNICESYGERGEALGVAQKKKISEVYENLSSEGFRVLGVAIRKVSPKKAYSKFDEAGMSFLGFLAFLDPPKKGVKATLEKLERFNIDIKIITGDNRLVTENISKAINFMVRGEIGGDDLAKLDDSELKREVEKNNVFTRISVEQKERIIKALRENGHVVGYLGDGVNDALSLREADVGISVNNAVDVAKSTADIILLRKGLQEIIEGVVEGRKTFANTFKYLTVTLSSNFGNMFSMPVASLILPFLPMLPSQILLNNLLYDSSQIAIAFDNVDEEFLRRPKKFEIGFMKRFMLVFGLLSSVFDFITFIVMIYILGFMGNAFQTGWFLESIATQTLVVNIVRSRQSVFKSRPSRTLILSTILIVAFAWILPLTGLAHPLDFMRLGPRSLVVIGTIVAAYLFVIELAKRYFYRKYAYLMEK